MNNQWDALKEYEAQSRQVKAVREQRLSEVQIRKRKEVDQQHFAREQMRRELEQQQSETKQLIEQQANDKRYRNEEACNTLLSNAAEELRHANQKSHEARVAVQQKIQEEQTGKKESPIERLFYEAWCMTYPNTVLIRQYHILKYRLDFAHLSSKVAIELDGQKFHSHKKDRNKDYKRQHVIEDEGWFFIRFTGSQVWSDVDSCISRTYKIINARIEETR